MRVIFDCIRTKFTFNFQSSSLYTLFLLQFFLRLLVSFFHAVVQSIFYFALVIEQRKLQIPTLVLPLKIACRNSSWYKYKPLFNHKKGIQSNTFTRHQVKSNDNNNEGCNEWIGQQQLNNNCNNMQIMCLLHLKLIV